MVVGICLSSASSRLGKDDPAVASFFSFLLPVIVLTSPLYFVDRVSIGYPQGGNHCISSFLLPPNIV
jgi:hypothetical protein